MNLDFGPVCAAHRPRANAASCDGARGRNLSRGLLYAAALALVGTFFAPLWHYNFTVPLYPEYPQGLPMTIYINHLEGRIDLINELNHYIGMRKIQDSDFVALRVMPWLVALLVAGALATATWGRDRLWPLATWLGVFAVSGLVLLGDFYWWLYTYSHDLNPHAAIRMPPFTPQLFGSYTILNTFHVMTWPGLGGIAMAASFALGFAAFAAQWLGRRAVARGGREHARVLAHGPAKPALLSWR
jgi:copper chaperone NosL